ncbi:trypco2 family protein [Actinomycetospora cinnamomea]|uniref:trypco2 family protein n=1 Tax=Actinomycetospora cinnamomea TaxID=663609 RepID=UPI00105815F6|nr:trypco2 family protein [Actinomycetospora cinnamomea]
MTDQGDVPVDGPVGEDEGLGLDEVLLALRRDLVAARGRRGEGYGLGVREVEIELAVEVRRRREAQGSVGAKWFVLSGDVSGGGERERTDTHRIRLTLGPVLPSAADGADADPPPGNDDPAGGETAAGVVGPAIAGALPDDAR